jgi:CRISPR-associated protein Csm2
MTPSPNRQLHNRQREQQNDISQEVVKAIHELKNGFKSYPIRTLVEHAEKFGPYLKSQRLETNQIRKFLDAINRIKVQSIQSDGKRTPFTEIETDIVLLKPKLAYAAARQSAVKPLSRVMSAAIDKVENSEDFERLVQFIESIIAYHKSEGGR